MPKSILIFFFSLLFFTASSQKKDTKQKVKPKIVNHNTSPNNPLSVKINFEKYYLPNGLTVILHQDTSVPVVAITALYHVGSKNEDSNRTGFAHFFEHLLFEGSKNIKRGEFSSYVSNNGGTLNANTTQDRTFYYEVLPSNQLELGLWLESERMFEANILEEGVATQREVVKEEKRQRIDNRPYGSIITEVLKRAYTVSPYRWPTIGSLDHLNQAALSEFIQFYKTYYVPNNCVLSIAGDFNVKFVKEKIKKYFSDIPKGNKDIVRPNIIEPPLIHEIRDSIEDNIQLPAVIASYRVPSQKSPDYYAFRILSDILANGESSRMNKVLVQNKQDAAFVGSFPYIGEDDGLLICFLVSNFGKSPYDLEKNFDSIVLDLGENLIPQDEFNKVKTLIETEIVSSKSSMVSIAEQLADYEVYFGDANLINTELSHYQAVSREDVLRVAKKYLQNDNRVLLYYLPKKMTN